MPHLSFGTATQRLGSTSLAPPGDVPDTAHVTGDVSSWCMVTPYTAIRLIAAWRLPTTVSSSSTVTPSAVSSAVGATSARHPTFVGALSIANARPRRRESYQNESRPCAIITLAHIAGTRHTTIPVLYHMCKQSGLTPLKIPFLKRIHVPVCA